jgi:ribose transport system substrate-binding protein
VSRSHHSTTAAMSTVLAIVVAVALAAGAGCNASRRKRIAVIPKGTAHLFWLSIQAGAEAAGRDLDVDVLWNGPALETEYARQIQIVDSMIAQHVDGIAIAAAEHQALVAPVERAAKAGIPVTVFDSGVDTEMYTTFVATDNYEAGGSAARTIAALLDGKGKIAEIDHTPGSQSTMERERGFTETMAREFPNIKIVARQYGLSDRAKAMAVTENILSAHPDLDGLFASAEPSSVGASQAVKARGMAGKLKFVTFDTSETMVEDLKAGVISAMMVQDPYKIGYEAVKSLAEKLRGGTPPRRMDLHVRVVRAQDLAEPDVQRLLNPIAQKK